MVQKLELHEIPYDLNGAVELLVINNELEKNLNLFFDKINEVFYLNLFAANFVNWKAREFKNPKIIIGK